MLLPLEQKSVLALDLEFWEQWIEEVSAERNLKPKSRNDVLGRLSSVWKRAVERQLVDSNPISGVGRKKVKKKKSKEE